jgi:hypothetical protein
VLAIRYHRLPPKFVASTPSARASLQCERHGRGHSPEYLPQIFETFKGWIRHVPMLGIGVFVARRALQWLGHPFEVRFRAGRGLRFSLFARAAR